MNAAHGFLVFDKPTRLNSRRVVDRVQKWFPKGTRVGHGGTLDPLASGILVVGVGSATRLLEHVQELPKTYRADILLGATSDTDDADGTITPKVDAVFPSDTALSQALAGFVGVIEQVPPDYSAAHVEGRRAYDLARKGRDVVLNARSVRVDAIRLIGYMPPRLTLEIDCGKGTYIRSIARDLGEQLACGGLITALRRTRIGPFDESVSLTLEESPEVGRSKLMPLLTAVAHWPRLVASEKEADDLRHGRDMLALAEEGRVAVVVGQDNLVALGRISAGRCRPEKVFHQ